MAAEGVIQKTARRSAALPGRALLVAGLLLSGPAAQAAGLTVYESRMPDGSLMLSDRPITGGKSARSHRYEVPAAKPGAVEAERDYWRQQNESFVLRQRASDSRQGRGRYGPPAMMGVADDHHPAWFHGYGAIGQPTAVWGPVPRTYTSSPGAVRGRDSGGFIGSGFATAR